MSSSETPSSPAYSRNSFTQAFSSDVQLLQCTIATRFPSGVVTMSIISLGLDSSFSRTIIEKEDVPAETLPVRGRTAFVATMPVPASPSGGQSGMPAFRWPETSRRFAPVSVRRPASSPAPSTFGRMSRSFQEYFFGAISSSNFSTMSAR